MTKIKWIIQDVGMIVSQIYRKYDALEYLNENVSGIGVIKNDPYISGLGDAIEDDINTKYVLLSGVRVLNLLKEANHISDVVEFPTQFQLDNSDVILKNLIDGLFYDFEKFDQKHYGALNLPLLNNEAMYIPLKDNLDTSFNEDKFIKPTRDLKAFDAGILKAGTTIGDYVHSINRQRFYMEENIVISETKTIIDEYRFFIVNNEVVAGSAYRQNKIAQVNALVPDIVFSYAKKYSKLYKPADIFTMDLAVLDNGDIKIIEYNCFNCSGVYLCDMVETFKSIRKYIETKN